MCQLHTSYSSLGKDFKNIFEELVKHVNSQREEANNLRLKASAAAREAIQADEDVSARLERCLKEERAQASQDRRNLLAQIATLVNQSGEAQDTRWESSINAVRSDVASARSTLDTANENYNTSMDVWSEKENLLVGEVLKSRDTLKSKMKDDWKSINEHNISIQATTKSVHEETIRIVDAQMKDMASQMQALDDFVTRARSQNERHHCRHTTSLQGLASTVHQSYSSIGDHFISTYDRVREIGADVSAHSTTLSASLPPLASTIQQPLADLRTAVTTAPLKEYVPTGETPRKIQYQYPTTLPHTEPHDQILGKPAPSSPPPPPPPPHNNNNTTNSIHSPQKSPSKSIVYTDAPPSSSATGIPPTTTTSSPSKDVNPASLREISRNVGASSLKRDYQGSSAATTMTAGKADAVVVDAMMGMGPPPLKRQATSTTMESKLPQKFGGGGGSRAGVVRLEGRENVGAGRRLRSSPNA